MIIRSTLEASGWRSDTRVLTRGPTRRPIGTIPFLPHDPRAPRPTAGDDRILLAYLDDIYILSDTALADVYTFFDTQNNLLSLNRSKASNMTWKRSV